VAVNRVIRVALADDHQVVVHALRTFLESHPDIRVTGVSRSGEDLLARLPGWERPDIIVIDLMMPGGIDGVETTRRVVQGFPEIGIVALTASTDESRMNAVLRAGASGYVRKDAEPEVLLKAIRSVARGRPFVDPSAAGDALVGGPASELSVREIDVLRQVAFGHTNREVGERLSISEETVKTHVGHILGKLGLQNRAQLVAYAVKRRLVDVEEL